MKKLFFLSALLIFICSISYAQSTNTNNAEKKPEAKKFQAKSSKVRKLNYKMRSESKPVNNTYENTAPSIKPIENNPTPNTTENNVTKKAEFKPNNSTTTTPAETPKKTQTIKTPIKKIAN